MGKKINLLIVGGSRGIGLALVDEALTERKQVTVVARKETPDLKDLQVNFINQDFNDISLIRPLLTNIQPDLLILCVAQGLCGNLLEFSDAQISQCIQASYTSTIFWIKEAIKTLPDNSKIGWISSLTAKVPSHSWSYYASSKAGVAHFIECVREPAMSRGISITVCYPGCVATDFHRYAGTQIPQGAIQPSDIAKDLLQAVENRLEVWASCLDKDVIETAYKFDKTYRDTFRDSLK
jgi:short-subunit dehydrogenase